MRPSLLDSSAVGAAGVLLLRICSLSRAHPRVYRPRAAVRRPPIARSCEDRTASVATVKVQVVDPCSFDRARAHARLVYMSSWRRADRIGAAIEAVAHGVPPYAAQQGRVPREEETGCAQAKLSIPPDCADIDAGYIHMSAISHFLRLSVGLWLFPFFVDFLAQFV